jgi:hypothetical protein
MKTQHDTYHRKHLSRDGSPSSPLARWMLPAENIRHVTANNCGDVIAPRKCVYRASRCLQMGYIILLSYCCVLDHVCVTAVASQWIYISEYIIWKRGSCDRTDWPILRNSSAGTKEKNMKQLYLYLMQRHMTIWPQESHELLVSLHSMRNMFTQLR